MTKKTEKTLKVIALALILGIAGNVSAAPKAANAAAQGKAQALHVVRVPSSSSTNIEEIADELGFFKEKGVRIEWIGQLPPGANSHVALASGAFDVTSGSHADSVIKVRSKGGKIKVILSSADAVKKYPHMAWFVLENSPIRTPKDLIGKKHAGLVGNGENIDISGCTGYGVAEYLRQSGIDIRKAKIEGVTLPAAQMEQALKQKLVDVATFHPPAKGKMENTPGYRRLFDDYQVISPITGKGATRITTASEKWLQRDPEGVRGYSAAMALAADWANAHEEEARQIFAVRMKIKPENVRNMDMFKWVDHQIVREKEEIQLWIDLMIRYGFLKQGEVKPKDVYTNDYNPYYKLLKEKKIKPRDILKEAEAIAARNYPSYLKGKRI
ncbi:MAG: ABC transporter substrate-binding protein [Desulfuromonadaceae bacterium]